MPPKLLSKTRTVRDYIGADTILNNPSCEKWRHNLIITMLTWAQNENSLDVMQFCMEYMIPRSCLYAWSKKYDDIAFAFAEMKLCLASHRRVGCMMKKLDGYSAFRDIHLLDPEEDENNKYHDERKRKTEDQKSHMIYIKIDEKGNLIRPNVISAEELTEQTKAITGS